MSLFTSLHPLARRTTLTLLITAEGDQLRVNVMPRPNDDAKGEKTLYPLSLLATPEELDAEFADAVSIYEPSIASVLDQARAASAANSNGSATAALPAPAGNKRKGGRPPKADKAEGDKASGENTGSAPPEVDPRQMSIDDASTPAGEAGNAAAASDASDVTATPASNAAASGDAGTAAASGSDAGLDAW